MDVSVNVSRPSSLVSRGFPSRVFLVIVFARTTGNDDPGETFRRLPATSRASDDVASLPSTRDARATSSIDAQALTRPHMFL
jgi:hypothetical protein|tara:strand:- start:6883 stop:7128 length:246 start_codon:yes stop_codon:yes gene_type:complete